MISRFTFKEQNAQELLELSKEVKELDVDQDISDILARQRNREVNK
jgi:hypothetical protein